MFVEFGLRVRFPLRDGQRPDPFFSGGERPCNAQTRVAFELLKQAIEHRLITIRCFDEQLSLLLFARGLFPDL